MDVFLHWTKRNSQEIATIRKDDMISFEIQMADMRMYTTP